MRRNTAHNTWNGITDVLCGRDNERACQKQDSCENIVQAEDGVVGLYLLELEIIL